MSRDARRSSISITEFTGSTSMFIVGLFFIMRLTFQRLESKTFPITPFTPAKLNIQKFQAHFIPWSKYLIALGSIFSSSVSSLKEKTGTEGAQENVTDGKAFATLSNSITLKPSDESIFDDFDAVVKSETAAAIFELCIVFICINSPHGWLFRSALRLCLIKSFSDLLLSSPVLLSTSLISQNNLPVCWIESRAIDLCSFYIRLEQ